MTKYFLAFVVPMLALTACVDTSDDSGKDEADTDTDADADTDTDADITAVGATFGDTTLDVTITGGSGTYNVGMAETGAGEEGWYGEDCFNGTGSFNLCHEAVPASFSVSRVETPAEVVEGTSTLLLIDAVDPADITFFVEDTGTGNCVVLGHDVTYYASFSCTTLSR